LIPHPQEDYDLLEERLLESLELKNPRIRGNHFFHQDKTGADSGFESASQTDEETEIDLPLDAKCPDCGKEVGLPSDRKWEIKVYAANGLMRAGAWAAAWREMEKVDIEIGICIPEDVRQEVISRFEAIKASQLDPEPDHQSIDDDNFHEDTREREVYGAHRSPTHEMNTTVPSPYGRPEEGQAASFHRESGVPWQRANYGFVKVLQDPKNLAIVLLGVILMYLIAGQQQPTPPLTTTDDLVQTPSVQEASATTLTHTSIVRATFATEDAVTSTNLAESSQSLPPDQRNVPDVSTSNIRLSDPEFETVIVVEHSARPEIEEALILEQQDESGSEQQA
jgi:hypothetical protein